MGMGAAACGVISWHAALLALVVLVADLLMVGRVAANPALSDVIRFCLITFSDHATHSQALSPGTSTLPPWVILLTAER